MAKNDAAKENAAILKDEEKLRSEREKAGWTTTEWGEFVPPVNEIDNAKAPANVGKNKVTENKVAIPEVAEPVEEK
jgi:hypothetical protein